MLDISHKYPTLRTAVAKAIVSASATTIEAIRDHRVPKGDPLEIARCSGTMAAKNTSGLIPYCHPIPIAYIGFEFELMPDSMQVLCTAKAIASTGVEMEAMTGAMVAALTIYDMLKGIDDQLAIEKISLVEKRGGKSDFREQPNIPLRGVIIVSSDTASAGKGVDRSGALIRKRLEKEGVEILTLQIIPDEKKLMVNALLEASDIAKADLIITTGGTGLGPRDVVPEATHEVIDRELPGVTEAIRAYGQERTPFAMLSRAIAGVRGKTLIINLPGSPKAVAESLNLLFPAIFHAFPMIQGESRWASADTETS